MNNANGTLPIHGMVESLSRGLLKQGFSQERGDAIVHALVDIAQSTQAIYGTIVPAVIGALDEPSDVFRDKLWDLREEFRHIDYHLRDAGLTEL